MTAFTPEAARALGGPDWLVERRLAAAEQLDRHRLAAPTPRRSGATAASTSSISIASDRRRATSWVSRGPSRRPAAARWRPRRASAPASSSCATAGSCTTSSTTPSPAKGVVVCGLATCEEADVAEVLGSCSQASPDAFTVLHDAFLAGGAFIKVPAGVVVDKPIIVLHWSEGDGLATFPHTLVVAEESAEVTVRRPLRLARCRRSRPPRRRRRRAPRRRQRPAAVPVGAGARTADVAGRAAARARRA